MRFTRIQTCTVPLAAATIHGEQKVSASGASREEKITIVGPFEFIDFILDSLQTTDTFEYVVSAPLPSPPHHNQKR